MGGETSVKSADQNVVVFTINGVQYSVGEEMTAGTTLNGYIRNHLNLRGTKYMCLEGGCGACIVSATIDGVTMSVNSCLTLIMNCNGWEIETIEGIGNRNDGYHPIQTRLAEMNGSQCGYCSPGVVMNMYSLVKDKTLTMKEIENSFGSNICRCTGYRPILDAFKSMASDADSKLLAKVKDIEESYKIPICSRPGADCCSSRPKSVTKLVNDTSYLHIVMEEADFYKVTTVDQLFEIFTSRPDDTYKLNGGNTACGVYRETDKPAIYIDINGISDLKRISIDESTLTLGGAVTLTTALESFTEYSATTGFEYLKHLASHIDLIGSVPLRNVSSLAGNLMMKNKKIGFTSDLFLMLETTGAVVHVLDAPSSKTSYSLYDFLSLDMDHKLIYSIVLPTLSSDYFYRSYKIMPRAQNSYAHINAGFLFRLDGTGTVVEQPNIIIGGIADEFLHASTTEEYLNGKNILDSSVVQEAMSIFDAEMEPTDELPKYSPAFRKLLSEGLLYKTILSIKTDELATRLQSGSTILERPLSSGKQDYETDSSLYPLNEPIPKIEAIFQTAGEAIYANDVKAIPGEVFCAFVLTTQANGTIESIDTTEALAMTGVIAFYSADDVPGQNLFTLGSAAELYLYLDEPLFVSGEILHYGQPIGIMVAETNEIARAAADKVSISYSSTSETKAIVTVQDAISSGNAELINAYMSVTATSQGSDTTNVITGVFQCGSQYHYTMEPQTCVCIPSDTDGVMDVYPSSQSPDGVQVAISTCLGVSQSSINVHMKRIGGAYGAKISRANQIAAACAIACYKLNRPARFIMQMESNLASIGKRAAVYEEYEVGVDDNGKIQYLNFTNWANAGASFNDPLAPFTAHHMPNCYDTSTWTYTLNEVMTNLPSNTWCRAPGATDGIAAIENIMTHIAHVLGKDTMDVRLQNILSDDGTTMEDLITDLKEKADYTSRKAAKATYNEENRWKKKGMSIIPLKYPLAYFGQFNAMVSIYARDGTVSVSHGGTECGQGINTKVAQVVAYTLGIDLNMVSVKPYESMISPNNYPTGGSCASEAVASAARTACQTLLTRLETVKATLTDPTWTELIWAAYNANVDLCARHMFTASDATGYNIWACAITEVEVDVLTGQHLVTRVDLLEDTGVSLSPEVDLGQIEGAYTMGMGYWTSEDLQYDPDTAELLTCRTWYYKPPGAKDIPVDFRVYFRKDCPNEYGVLSSKATGEPAGSLSYGVILAIRDALDSARSDAGNTDWYTLHGPCTTEKILLNSLTDRTLMTLES